MFGLNFFKTRQLRDSVLRSLLHANVTLTDFRDYDTLDVSCKSLYLLYKPFGMK